MPPRILGRYPASQPVRVCATSSFTWEQTTICKQLFRKVLSLGKRPSLQGMVLLMTGCLGLLGLPDQVLWDRLHQPQELLTCRCEQRPSKELRARGHKLPGRNALAHFQPQDSTYRACLCTLSPGLQQLKTFSLLTSKSSGLAIPRGLSTSSSSRSAVSLLPCSALSAKML